MDFGIEKKFFSKRHFSEIEISIFFRRSHPAFFTSIMVGFQKIWCCPKNTLGVHTIIIEKKTIFILIFSYFFVASSVLFLVLLPSS